VAKKQSSKSKHVCQLCKDGRRTFIDDSGIRWHSWKESNGMDYDNYTYPCTGTDTNFAAYRKQSLEFVKKEVDKAQGKLSELRSVMAEIKAAKHIHQITTVVERMRNY
jgi:hypothetical protein